MRKENKQTYGISHVNFRRDFDLSSKHSSVTCQQTLIIVNSKIVAIATDNINVEVSSFITWVAWV